MDQEPDDKLKTVALTQAAYAAMGATVGVFTKHAIDAKKCIAPGGTPIVAQVASAMGAAAATGAGVYGTVAAGGAVVTAEAAAVGAVVGAAAPVVGLVLFVGGVAAGTWWGLSKLDEYLEKK